MRGQINDLRFVGSIFVIQAMWFVFLFEVKNRNRNKIHLFIMLNKKVIDGRKCIRSQFIVRIHEINVSSTGHSDTCISCAGNATVGFVYYDDVFRIFMLIFITDSSGSIGGSVIDKNKLHGFEKTYIL